MARIIEMPKLSDTMEEGAIASWLVKEGDAIDSGEPLAEIETDKATMEYTSPDEGTILKILVPAGTSCPLNAAIAVIGEPGETFDLDSLLTQAAGPNSSPHQGEAPKPTSPRSTPMSSGDSTRTGSASSAEASNSSRLMASPLARKVAEQKGITLSSLTGSGPRGRIILRDVEAVKTQPTEDRGQPMPEASEMALPAGGVGDERIPLSMMRKTIAKRLLAAKNQAPHFYLNVSADMTKLLDWRQQLNQGAPEIKISVNDLLVLAVSRALRRHKGVNASWQEDHILQHGDVHLAIAVALPEGLVTPVVRYAHQLGVRDIALQARALVTRAKNSQLTPDEYQGGTFTISNLGMMGIESFTAIINPPQAAILAVGATMPTPWVDRDGQVVVKPRMTMTLSCDHRVIDGALGAQFLQTLVGFIEDPLAILV